MLKVVVDTNQFVSSIIHRYGPSAQLLQAWRDYHFILILSQKILEEIKRVLQYPHIKQKYNLNQAEIESLIQMIEQEAVVLSESMNLDVVKDDPDDNKILACAIEAQADYIVSGDHHLLDLHQYQTIPIITVKEFLQVLKHI